MDLKVTIQKAYSYLEDSDIELLVNRAKSIALDQLYPNDLSTILLLIGITKD